MKRLLVVLVALFVPGIAFAFNTNRTAVPAALHIAILRSPPAITPDEALVQTKLVHYLTSELKSRGFDAYATDWTYDDARSAESVSVDYLVEIAGAGADHEAWGGIDIGGRNAELSLGMLVSHVAAELRVYDAQTMELIATETLQKRTSGLSPTSIGFGGGDVFAWIAMPFFERAQVRSATKAAARDAAVVIARAVR